MSAQTESEYYSSSFFCSQIRPLKNSYLFLPARWKNQFSCAGQTWPVEKIAPHVPARPVEKIIPHLPARPVEKIIPHSPGRSGSGPRARPGPMQSSSGHNHEKRHTIFLTSTSCKLSECRVDVISHESKIQTLLPINGRH